MFGLLNINKPSGQTSRDTVNRVQSLVRPAKVGHSGTLDPIASGILVMTLGSATRLTPYLQKLDKRYRAMFLLGRRSNTDDIEGEVIELSTPHQPTRQAICQELRQLTGIIEQRPPVYSAIKIRGKRAYKRARAGEIIQPESRPVHIHQIDLLQYDYPKLVLDIRCGSGTYVRSLGRDLAENLSTAAVMSELVRTQVGPFHLQDAIDPDRLDLSTLEQQLLSPLLAINSLEQRVVDANEIQLLAHGRTIPLAGANSSSQEIVAVDSQGNLVAILVHRNGELGPRLNFKKE